jgi:hypothetical protein
VATILGRDVATARRALRAARARYLAAAGHWLDGTPVSALPAGDISRRVDEAAARAIGTRSAQALR